MFGIDASWTWISILGLGGFHGLNPAMGWLFAVALGFQQRNSRAVITALGPIALGHALSIGIVVAIVWSLGLVVPQAAVMVIGGGSMVAFVLWKVTTRFRHPAWVGMRVTRVDILARYLQIATANRAGLIHFTAVVRLRPDSVPAAAALGGHHMGNMGTPHSGHIAGAGDGLVTSLLAVGLHTAAMLAVGGTLALIVYHKVGVDILRNAWLNIDLIWIGALGITGSLTLILGMWRIAV